MKNNEDKDTRIFDLAVARDSNKKNNIRVGGIMFKDINMYALINKDINFSGFDVPDNKDCVFVKMNPMNDKTVEVENYSLEKDIKVFNLKVKVRTVEFNGEKKNVWRKVGIIMKRKIDEELYMLINRWINFAGYDTPENSDSVFVHIFPVDDVSWDVIEDQ